MIMPISVYIIISVLFVSAISLGGIVLFSLGKQSMERNLFWFISFAVGGLIGDVFIHILPEIAEGDVTFFPIASLIILGGLLLSFILEKVIHWRHCHHSDCPEHPKPFGTMNLVGDALHNVIDGMLIAGSFYVDVRAGIATTIAVALHEIPQEMGDYAILLYSGYSKGRALFLNVVTALSAVGGAVLVMLLRSSTPDIERYLLPLVAGNFLYIAVADLLPELHKQTRIRDAGTQLLGVLAGVGLMFALTFLE